jgi:glutamyl-tRNA synthetase
MSDRPTLVRFAPSPTGYLHIGNARPALWNWLFAKRHGGRFMLRLDDTDTERSRPEFEAAIHEDLAWLGIHPDVVVRQSDRLARYAEAFAALKQAGLLYPAYETAEELERKRKRLQAMGAPPVYDRAALKLSDGERAKLEAAGRLPHWRFRLSGETARWQDGVRGDCHIETDSLSDPVLVRADGTVLYTFASVVDDADFAISDVIRGEDHVANTAVQIELFRALGAPLPRFAHINLIVTLSGEEMSKRKGSLSLRSFREAGVEPEAVAAVAVLTGTSQPVKVPAHLDDLAAVADLAIISRAQTRFDPAEIQALSTRSLHDKPFAAVAERLAALGIAGERGEALWLACRGNLTQLSDITLWREVVEGPLAGTIEDAAFTAQAAALLPQEPFDQGTWGLWTEAVKAATGAKGKALFMPLRLALTGQPHGPDLKALLPLLGRERALARLHGHRA